MKDSPRRSSPPLRSPEQRRVSPGKRDTPVTIRLGRPAPHVGELIMDRPEALNALSTAQAETLITVCHEVEADRTIRAAVLSSAVARAFCVGADLKERKDFTDEQMLAQRAVFVAAFGAVRDLGVPIVAAVHGFALGGGMELALSCDLIVADATAVFGLPEVGVGLVPGGGGTQLLSRRIGLGRALDLILTGRRVEASEAHRLGIADRLVGAGTDRSTALDVAIMIASRSPRSVRAARHAVKQGYGIPLDEGLALEEHAWRELALSADRHEGIAAFTEHRAASWPDE